VVWWLALALHTVALFADGERIAVVARRALALVTARHVLADSVETASRLVVRRTTLVDVITLSALGVSGVAALADTHTVAQVLVCHAHFCVRTRQLGSTRLRYLELGAAVLVWVARRAAGTLTRVAAGLVVADGSDGTRVGQTLVDVRTARGLARVACAAQTLRSVVDQHTLRVRSTGHAFARMSAFIANVWIWAVATVLRIADSVAGTVGVGLARYDSDTSDLRRRIRESPVRTLATVRPRRVGANGSRAAGVRSRTLVDVKALFEGIAGKAGLTLAAEASRSVGTICVGATTTKRSVDLVTLIDINTASCNVQRVKGPAVFTNTVRLIAIGLAECMFPTRDVFARLFTRDGGRGADVARRTVALEPAGRVDASRMRSARLRPTLIQVHTHGALRLEPRLAETLAFHTLGVVHTVKVALAQHCHVNLFTSRFWVWFGRISLGTSTVVSWHSVFTLGVNATRSV